MTCSKGVSDGPHHAIDPADLPLRRQPGCKYSHDWALTAEQLDVLARNAKKAPCNYLKNGACPSFPCTTSANRPSRNRMSSR